MTLLHCLILAHCELEFDTPGLEKPIETKMKGFLINPTYADDLTIAGTNKIQVNEIKQRMTIQLEKYNLKVNTEKTERYEIPRAVPTQPTIEELIKHKNNKEIWSEHDWITNYEPENTEPDWRKCKLLGSMLDTQVDINRRKLLTIDSMKSFQDIYKSKRISTALKVRTFNAYSASVFLYNSELWTLTDTLEKKIDSFHRKLLTRVINICWPKLISNERLYEKTEATKWSVIIRKKRLNWLGHLMRLDRQTPVRLALFESLQPGRRKRVRPRLTWMMLIEKDLELGDIKVNLKDKRTPEEKIAVLEGLTEDRSKWRKTVKDIMTVNR